MNADPVRLPMSLGPLLEAAKTLAKEHFEAGVEAILRVCPADEQYRRPTFEGDSDREIRIDTEAALLADLSRPASMDFWARWLANEVGCFNEKGEGVGYAFGPVFDTLGAWRLYNYNGTHCTFSEDEDNEDGDSLNVPGIAKVDRHDPVGALRLILLLIAEKNSADRSVNS